MATILSNFNRFTFFSSEDSLANLQTIPPLLAHVAALPCETLMSEKKQAINDKLQGGLATYLRRGEVFNNQIKKGLLLSLSVIFLIGEYMAKLQATTWLSRALLLIVMCWPGPMSSCIHFFGLPCI